MTQIIPPPVSLKGNNQLNRWLIEVTNILNALQSGGLVRNGSGVPAAGLGSNGDLYLNNTGGAGTRLYGKIANAWVAIA